MLALDADVSIDIRNEAPARPAKRLSKRLAFST
jgi:hypothetical protein